MTTLIDYLTTNRIRGGRFVFAYTVGGLFGIALALVALMATGAGP